MLLAQHAYRTATPLPRRWACSVWRTFQVVSACSLSCCVLASLQMQLLLRPKVSAQSTSRSNKAVSATAAWTLAACTWLWQQYFCPAACGALQSTTEQHISCSSSEHVLLPCVDAQ
jgi:hypothetical protein